MIAKNSIAFFFGAQTNNSAKKYDYSLYQRKGFINIYFTDYRAYPDYLYNINELGNLRAVKYIIKKALWRTEIDKFSAMGMKDMF